MPNSVPHLGWLRDTGRTLPTECGLQVPIWEFEHQPDNEILSKWAAHFRSNYCDDALLDELRKGEGLTRSAYLTKYSFPEKDDRLGRATRSGDFSELMLCDYLEFVLAYTVPRERYRRKWNANISTPGCDVLGYKFDGKVASRDTLYTIEVKGALSDGKAGAIKQFQKAIDDSEKDQERIGYSLNALRNIWLDTKQTAKADEVFRFQDPLKRPYRHIIAAALVVTEKAFDELCVASVTAKAHSLRDTLQIIVVKGADLMTMTHALYERAATQAD